MTPHQTLQLAGVSCDVLTPKAVLSFVGHALESDGVSHIVTLNAEMVVQARRNGAFRRALEQATLRIPDGAGIFWANDYLTNAHASLAGSLLSFFGTTAPRTSGVDLIPGIIARAAARGMPVYIIGGKQTNTVRAIRVLQRDIPTATIYTSPDHTYSIDGPADILADIQKKQPGVIFVAYGAPNQALWIAQHAHTFPSIRLAMGVGGSFDTISGALPRAPRWMRTHNLEWLWRLVLQPQRLSRIFRAIILFPILVWKQKHAA